MSRLYDYVGPERIREASKKAAAGRLVRSPEDVRTWTGSAESVIVTFVIDASGGLRIADRHSEHVACAAGGSVLSAGEMTFAISSDAVVVEEVTNQSTGYCPEPESWSAVAAALDRAGIVHPGAFTTELIFRHCPRCGQCNVIKDQWYVCEVCEADLPRRWDFIR